VGDLVWGAVCSRQPSMMTAGVSDQTATPHAALRERAWMRMDATRCATLSVMFMFMFMCACVTWALGACAHVSAGSPPFDAPVPLQCPFCVAVHVAVQHVCIFLRASPVAYLYTVLN